MRLLEISAVLVSLCAPLAAATFGTVVAPPGGASYSDIVLDESRSRLYLVNNTSSRIEIYNLKTKAFLPSIATNGQPVSAALSRDGRSLFVTAFADAILDVIDLTTSLVTNRISLPTSPEGVAVGADGRVLITAVAATGTANTLLIYDPAAPDQALIDVPVVPPPSTPPAVPVPSGRIFVSYRSRLLATPDGKWIVGSNGNTATNKVVFVYEAASGTVLRSRSVTNLSTTLAISPDGKKFMAGSTLFDATTLQVIAQENAANAPFTFPAGAATNFNTQQNEGGSAFSPDGSVLYGAFNIAPVGAARPQISQLLVNDPDNLLINLGIEMPENLAGKMTIDSTGADIYALSDSGFTLLPVGTIAQSPLAVPQSQSILLTSDVCGVFKATTASDTINNLGKGRFTASVNAIANGAPGGGPVPAPAVSVVNTGATPVVNFRFNSAAAVNPGTLGPSDFLVTSPEAINIPGVIHAFQNNRDSISPATIFPVSVNALTSEGLTDILFDSPRQRVYLANSGLNRIEVFDAHQKVFLAPIKVGQLPHAMAMSADGNTLYVANTGGESIVTVDLAKDVQSGRIAFPALPFNAAVNIANPVTLALSGRGPQFVMSDGSLWKIEGNQAIPRALNPAVFGAGARTVPGGTPALWTMAATPGGEYVFLLSGTGTGYLYDYTIDDFTTAKQVLTTPLVGYVGPLSAGPQGRYYTVGGTILNASLTPILGSTNGISTSGRLVSAVTALSSNQIAEFTQPVRVNPAAPVTDAGMIELSDPTTGASAGSAATLEGPATAVNGLARTNAFARTLAVDTASATAFAITASGLSVVSLTPAAAGVKPTVNSSGVVSTANMQPALAPGELVSILGKNFGSSQTAAPPYPTLLGGVCVTLNNQPIPLAMTSSGQINAQVPVTLAAGRYPLVVRSIDAQSESGATTVTIAKYAPAVLVDNDGQAAIMHHDGTFANQSHPAKRDEMLFIYATGLGATHGGAVVTGAVSPSSPLAVTDPVSVYFGNPLYKQAAIIVNSSNLLPGMVGVAQITVTVPGFHIKGSSLPVTLKIGGVSSPAAGSSVPVVAVN